MLSPTRAVKDRFLKFATELRFPRLLALAVTLFAVDLFIPYFIPFADEILLGLFAALLATLKAGAAYLPLDPDYPAPRLAYMMADAQPALLITDAQCRARSTGARPIAIGR